jgi:hypothetical protein
MDKRVFEGVPRLFDDEDEDLTSWFALFDGQHLTSTDLEWLGGLEGRRVRITVEDLGPVTDTAEAERG